MSWFTSVGALLAVAVMSSALDAQGQNPINLWSVPLTSSGGRLIAGNPVKLTHDDGINSQPSFTPDGRAIVFSATRDTGSTARSEIYRYHFATGRESRVTRTPENENSPTVNSRGEYMALRWVPATLFREYGPWVYAPDGRPRRGVLPGADTTGYYTPVGSGRYILTRPKSRTFTVAMFDSAAGAIVDLDSGVPALPAQRIPRNTAISYVVLDSASARHELRRYDLVTRRRTSLGRTVPGRTTHAWLPNGGTVLMAKGSTLYSRRAGATGRDTAWSVVATFSTPELRHTSAYAISPDGTRLIMTSPKRPPLAVVVRDSLESGRSAIDITPVVLAWRAAGRLGDYDVNESALSALGDVWLGRRLMSDAVALHSLTADLFPSSHRAAGRLGDAQAAAGDRAGAAVSYRRALTLNPRATDEDRKAADSIDQRLKELR
ncbi:MAG: hypothetical protein WKF55_08755 [Gemmatimonadaceae bacterium]